MEDRSLWLALGLTIAVLVVEVISGLLAGSLALLSEAARMLTISASLIIAIASSRRKGWLSLLLSGRRPLRFALVTAASNAVLLGVVCFYILYESWSRIDHPQPISAEPMLLVAILGLVCNLVAARLITRGREDSRLLTIERANMLGDSLAISGLVLAGLVIATTGSPWIDALLAMLIGLWVVRRAWTLLDTAVDHVADADDGYIESSEVERFISQFPGVAEHHDTLVRSRDGQRLELSVHVVTETREPLLLVSTLRHALMERFSFGRVTVQVERVPCTASENGVKA
jgi:cobalt-zinc-cadmium efflux system protein